MRRLGLLFLALSCSREPPPPSAPWAGSQSKPVDCTRVLDDPARTTVRMSPDERSQELHDAVKAIRAKSGLSEVGGGSPESHPPDVTRRPSGRSPCDALARAPVVVITKDELRVGDTHVMSLAEANANDDVIDALSRALQAADGASVAILLADESTGAIVVNRVVIACKRAGYGNLLFAVTGRQEIEATRQIRF
ncbi:MAG: hypothetical protein M4D80_19890 [Myxococcota bacterium]|nr:hypothetical protein [Deltaproteobacteria bacterium]MDQ3337430.1 hypothetical protein [Myxococcota bacterium]